MNTKLVASRDLRRSAPVALLLATVALTVLAAEPASAARPQPSLLQQGVGMGAKPSHAVRRMQKALRRHGYSLGAPGVDGRFGPITNGAVRRFQRHSGLVVDGLVGRRTNRALRRPVKPGSRQKAKSPASAQTKRKPAAKPKPKAGTTPKPKPQTTPTGTAKPGAGTTPSGTGTPKARTTPSAPAANVPARTTPRPAGGSGDGGTPWWLAWIAAAVALLALCGAVVVSLRDRRGKKEAPPLPPDPEPEPPGDGRELEQLEAGLMDSSEHVVAAGAPHAPAAIADPAADGRPMIGYVTLAADASREEVDEPTRAIGEACKHAGCPLVDVVTDRESGRALSRPGLAYALKEIAAGKAGGLVISELRRLTTSTMELATLLEWFRRADASLVALDMRLDTSTAPGREVATAIIRLGRWERERIGERTRSGMADVRAGGETAGRPSVSDQPELLERITELRAAGMTLQGIADRLNAEGIPTLRGGAMWRPSSVQAALGYRRPGSRSPLDQLPSTREGRHR